MSADECSGEIAKRLFAMPRVKLALALLDVREAEMAIAAERRCRALKIVSG